MIGLAIMAGGCKVLSIEDARAVQERSNGALDSGAYLSSIWPDRAGKELRSRAVPIDRLKGADMDALGRERGNRSGDGSPWTFVVSGEGVVRSVDRENPRGRIELDTQQGPVTIQVGPVVSGTAIRDALPFITFDGFPDQVSYAEVGMGLTDRALAPLRPVITQVKPGDRVRFLGAASVGETGVPLVVTPIELAR